MFKIIDRAFAIGFIILVIVATLAMYHQGWLTQVFMGVR